MPGQSRHGAGQHGHLRVRTRRSCSTSCAATPPTRTRATISATTSSPIWSSTARPWRTASRSPASSPTARPRPTGATPARSTPIGRPTSTSPASSRRSTSTTSNWPIWTYAEITPPAKFVHDEDGRRGMAVNSLVSGGCIVSGARPAQLAAVHRRPGALLRQLDGAVVAALCRHRPHARLRNVVDRPRREDPRGAGGRRGPGARRQALPPHRARASCLITQPMIDRLAG